MNLSSQAALKADTLNFSPPKVLAKLVTAANFIIQSETKSSVPSGPLVRRRTGPFAKKIVEEEEFIISSYVNAINAMMSASLADGQLEGPKGPITLKEDLKRLMETVDKGYREVGALMDIMEIVATKPVA